MDLISACCSVIFTCLLSAVSSIQENIIAVSKQKTILTCLVPNNDTYTAVEWNKFGLGKEYVLLYRNGHFESENQHPSFRNRVNLQETLMKDGDVSLIVNDVSTADSGTYECKVYMKGTNNKLISNITLSVDPPGQSGGDTEDGGKEDEGEKDEEKEDEGKQDKVNRHYGLVASGLFILVLLVALVIASKLPNRNLSNHLPSDEPADICSEIRVSGG